MGWFGPPGNCGCCGDCNQVILRDGTDWTDWTDAPFDTEDGSGYGTLPAGDTTSIIHSRPSCNWTVDVEIDHQDTMQDAKVAVEFSSVTWTTPADGSTSRLQFVLGGITHDVIELATGAVLWIRFIAGTEGGYYEPQDNRHHKIQLWDGDPDSEASTLIEERCCFTTMEECTVERQQAEITLTASSSDPLIVGMVRVGDTFYDNTDCPDPTCASCEFECSDCDGHEFGPLLSPIKIIRYTIEISGLQALYETTAYNDWAGFCEGAREQPATVTGMDVANGTYVFDFELAEGYCPTVDFPLDAQTGDEMTFVKAITPDPGVEFCFACETTRRMRVQVSNNPPFGSGTRVDEHLNLSISVPSEDSTCTSGWNGSVFLNHEERPAWTCFDLIAQNTFRRSFTDTVKFSSADISGPVAHILGTFNVQTTKEYLTV